MEKSDPWRSSSSEEDEDITSNPANYLADGEMPSFEPRHPEPEKKDDVIPSFAPKPLERKKKDAGPAQQPPPNFHYVMEKGKALRKFGPPPGDLVKSDQMFKLPPDDEHPIYLTKEQDERRQTEQKATEQKQKHKEERKQLPKRKLDQVPLEELKKIQQIPRRLLRQDQDFEKEIDVEYKRKKAHLTATGLKPAGTKRIKAMDQQDGFSAKKAEGNRISFKHPAKEDAQKYGGQELELKARKLAIAKAKQNQEAMNTDIRTTDDIVGEIERDDRKQTSSVNPKTGRVESKEKDALISFARRDREFHAIVSEGEIPGRFIARGKKFPEHVANDSDSEDDERLDTFIQAKEDTQREAKETARRRQQEPGSGRGGFRGNPDSRGRGGPSGRGGRGSGGAMRGRDDQERKEKR